MYVAGVTITDHPVSEHVPLVKSGESIITQYTMTTPGESGLLRMSFLGLRNLSVFDDA